MYKSEDRFGFHGRNRKRSREKYGNSKNTDETPGPSKPYRHRKRRGPGGPPPGLKGKEIGMYYKNKYLNKTKENMRMCVTIPELIKKDILSKLSEVDSVTTSIKKETDEENKYGHISEVDSVTTSIKRETNEENKYGHISDSVFKSDFLFTINTTIEQKLKMCICHDSLKRNSGLDSALISELKDKQRNNENYKKMMEFRKKLPSYDKKEDILQMIDENQIILISGETGCGKTTQVAQFILDDYIMKNNGSLCKVVCTQPRRISAISVAERVANERDEKLGFSVGYLIRLEKALPRNQGSILFCTTGVLLKQLQSNPALEDISHLILDEIHERNKESDFILTLLKQIIIKRPTLKVILMSATLNAEQFSKYYNNCPVLNIPGFTFPVTEYYLEDILVNINFHFTPYQHANTKHVWKKHTKYNRIKTQENIEFNNYILPYVRNLAADKKYTKSVIQEMSNPNSELLSLELIVELIIHICHCPLNDAILVFLPGFSQISSLITLLEESGKFPPYKYLILPLHSKMPTVEQKQIFDKPPKGMRKIIVSTNIAETSITIDDVVYVIDCGRIKIKSYDVKDNIETLKVEWVSSANAKQRRGRAGRVQPGVCYHLYSRAREMTFASYQLPEMLRTRLHEIVLSIKILQLGKVADFLSKVMDPPDPEAIKISLCLLKRLNALDDDENLTPLGYHLAKLPLDPQTGKMILMGALFNCVDPVFSVAASLSFKDAFQLPLGKQKESDRKRLELSNGQKSDHLVLIEALKQFEAASENGLGGNFCYEHFLSKTTLQQLIEMKKQFAEYLFEMGFLKTKNVKDEESNINSENMSVIKAVICAGLYPNVAMMRNHKKLSRKFLRTIEDGKVSFFPSSVNYNQKYFESPFLCYYEKYKSNGIFLRDTTMVYPFPLLFFGDKIKLGRDDQGRELIFLNNEIKFRCLEDTSNVILKLRQKLDWLLEYKAGHPGIVDWYSKNTDVVILKLIMSLISIEDAYDGEICDVGE